MKRLLVVLSVSALLTLGACSGGDDQQESTGSATTAAPAPTPTATTSSPTPTPSATATEDPAAPAIDYDTEADSGTVVADPAAADSLPKASADFKQFIATELKRLQDESGDECTNKPQIRVSKLQTAGWASGGVFTPECGGYSVLWAKTGGEWAQVWGGQQLVDCDTLMRYKFPVSVAGTSCLGQDDSPFPYTG